MASLIDKIKEAIHPSAESDGERGRGAHSSHRISKLNPDHSDPPRSQSRGRNLVATGRGGAGNMSRSRVRDGSEPSETPADVVAARSRSRSRARMRHHGEDLPVAAGRGGLGNVRSESRDAQSREREHRIDEEDAVVEKAFEAKHARDEHLAGRGGLGNVMHHGQGVPAKD